MTKPILIAELCAGPYTAQIYHHDGGLLKRFEVQIWDEGDFLCHKIRSGVREVLYDLAAGEEWCLRKFAGQTDARAKHAGASGEPFIELCRETAELLTHLSWGNTLDSFPGYRLAPDEHHHVYFKDRRHEQDHEISR
jgi:hypothetical protein